MGVEELNHEQRVSLKQHYYSECHPHCSYGELASADELVPDEVLNEVYAGYVFVEKDFFVSEV